MFGKEFYPTPKPVIAKMLEKLGDVRDKYILEPSAGRGDILDYVKEQTNDRCELFAIELDTNLVSVLRSKGYRVIDNDFLQYVQNQLFDVVIMNPPFSNGDEHLLKAWNILESGEIVCILNAETVRNPYTKRRELLARIIQQHGTVEYLHDEFCDAERKTSVEVALVHLKKTVKKDRFQFTPGRDGIDTTELGSDIQDEIAVRDEIHNLILCFERSREAYAKYLQVHDEMNHYTNIFFTDYDRLDRLLEKTSESRESRRGRYNIFISELKQLAWRHVFTKTKIQDVATQQVRQDFEKFQQENGSMDFTKENIEQVFHDLFMSRGKILQNCLIDIFDFMTSFDHKNKTHYEGWKTNSAHAVNRKVILPYFVEFGDFSNKFHRSLSRVGRMNDIDKVMCRIDGKKIENITTIADALEMAFHLLGEVGKGAFCNEAESHYFRLKFYKKGTLHLTFKDRFIWEQFNLLAAKGKKWLPDGDIENCKPTERVFEELSLPSGSSTPNHHTT